MAGRLEPAAIPLPVQRLDHYATDCSMLRHLLSHRKNVQHYQVHVAKEISEEVYVNCEIIL